MRHWWWNMSDLVRSRIDFSVVRTEFDTHRCMRRH
ncbi:MAG: hypothetical protein LBU42_00225 [Prevotellaceae bacterium]|nr:hypothetical protein [Prevotellaceae bacterium]